MRTYERGRVHLLFAVISLLVVIWIPEFAKVWDAASALIMTVILLFVGIMTFLLIRITPRHNDDIYYHIKDEKKRIRGHLNNE